MKRKIGGFSFKKNKSGAFEGVPGKEKLPHRVDIIKNMLSSGFNPIDIFFNFKTPDCENGSDLNQIGEEIKLYDQWSKTNRESIF